MSKTRTFGKQYPNIVAWVRDGWIEIGYTDYSSSFIRVLDEGGMVWEGGQKYPSLEAALAAADDAIAEWSDVHLPNMATEESDEESATPTFTAPTFTAKQGQYLAFIYNYTQIHGRPPAQADIQQYFRVSPPTVHQMILKLEELELLSRTPGQARALHLLVPAAWLPILVRPA